MDPIGPKKPIGVAILTVSDTRTPTGSADDETFDSSGHGLKELINVSNIIGPAHVVAYDCVADDVQKIQAKLIEWCSREYIDILLSTGGTGIGPRDVTPEATLGVIEILTPGISQAIMYESLKITPMAMLSRAVSGILKKTLIINLPGSKKAARECLQIVACTIPHAVSLIRDEKEIAKQFHNQCISRVDTKTKVPECVSKIACRHRESPFSKINMELALRILKEQSCLQYDKNNKMKFPTVCIFSTGDELESDKDTIRGYIRDTNSLMIKNLLKQDNYHGQVLHFGVVRDNWNDLCKQFEEAFNEADIVVTSGGVSMGEKDLIKHVLNEHFKSRIHFGRVDMKPGMPTTFATLSFKNKKKYIFCLPGNPVSAGVCTHLFLLPYLRSISGRRTIIHNFKAKLTHSIEKLDVRPEYKRALMKYENGEFHVSTLTNYQQSSRLLSFSGSNCLLQLPSSTEKTNIEANTIMNVILIKSIENTYVSPILEEKILTLSVFKKPNFMYNPHMLLNRIYPSELCINEVLDFMTEYIFILKTKYIPTADAMGYVSYSPLYSSENVPPFPASIKDGYAINHVNTNFWSQERSIFNVVQVSVAGTAPNHQKHIREGECARISTGAPIPPGANCVVQVEDTSVVSKSSDGTIEMTICVQKEPEPFDNIREIGSDISMDQLLLDEKTELGPFEIALLLSVGCKELCVYQCPTIHIIPYVINMTYGSSNVIKNILKEAGFKDNVFTYPVCEKLNDIPEHYGHVFENDDIIIICGGNDYLNLETICDVEIHFYIKYSHFDDQIISPRFGVLHLNKKRMIFFHTTNYDSDYIYNFAHLFILPFLRSITGRKQRISAITTKSNTSYDLPKAKFEKSELNYVDGDFEVTCYTLNRPNCLAKLPFSTKIIQNQKAKTELDVIVTENSDSYFLRY